MATKAPKPTPMMKRYLDVKAQNPGSIVLFRMGDFYETFYDDAETIAPVLGLPITTRGKGSSDSVPMAGFPYHQLEPYLRKLVKAGHRVSVCEPADGKPSRPVTRVES